MYQTRHSHYNKNNAYDKIQSKSTAAKLLKESLQGVLNRDEVQTAINLNLSKLSINENDSSNKGRKKSIFSRKGKKKLDQSQSEASDERPSNYTTGIAKILSMAKKEH